jgi:hypothetical protein
MAEDPSMKKNGTEFDRQFAVATRKGKERLRTGPLAKSVRFQPGRGVVIELDSGCQVCLPLEMLPELHRASPKDLRQVEIMGVGQAIQWPTLDYQFGIAELLAEVLGSKSLSMPEKRGGRVKSKATSTAARSNGTKGGRPRKRS